MAKHIKNAIKAVATFVVVAAVAALFTMTGIGYTAAFILHGILFGSTTLGFAIGVIWVPLPSLFCIIHLLSHPLLPFPSLCPSVLFGSDSFSSPSVNVPGALNLESCTVSSVFSL